MKPPDRLNTNYRGWKLAVVRGQPFQGTATRKRTPHQTYRANGHDFAQVLKGLRAGIDAFEARLGGTATSPR